MKTCMICNQPVAAGFIVCGDCAKGTKNGELSRDTMHFIERLTGDILNETDDARCYFCDRDCYARESDPICSQGIQTWLLDRAKQYLGAGKPDETSR